MFGKKVRDPVCGMKVDKGKVVFKSNHHGVTYYFCSEHCKNEFEKNPAKYLTEEPAETAGHHSGHHLGGHCC